jgi:hypothetical protein
MKRCNMDKLKRIQELVEVEICAIGLHQVICRERLVEINDNCYQ